MNDILNFDDEWFDDKHFSIIQDWVEKHYNEFMQSEYFSNLDEISKENSRFILNVFFDYCYSYFLISPDNIRTDMMEEIMLDLFPRKVSADKETFETFEPTMISFLLWCQERGLISNVGDICNIIKLLSTKMIERSQDSSAWGVAKSFFYGGSPTMDSENLDIKNLLPIRRDTPKIGRNDPCSCGSGKKYKKCCGG
ncbi:MAG: SEC-C metal-binding domain-containing protein [Burkholderiales bacterium]|jgi:hypothetical protein|nr:SEC-C metal-binding domain-containing protein [Burkholderiales bacterium]